MGGAVSKCGSRPGSSASSENLLEIWNPLVRTGGSNPTTALEALGLGHRNCCFHKPSRGFSSQPRFKKRSTDLESDFPRPNHS